MGSRMAKNLLKNGINLTVWNRSDKVSGELEKAGAGIAASIADAVKEADIVFTMLSAPDAVKELAFKDGGFVSQMKKNAVWVDCSTVNPSFSETCRQVAVNNHVRFIDAPVAGSKPQAENAELLFFVGGKTEDVKEIEPLLNFMGKKIIHVGETGKGTSFKMLVNSMLGQSMVVFAETALLGQKMGLSKDILLNTLPELVVTPPFIKAKAKMISSADYDLQFPLELMHKDLHLLSITANENKQPMFLANMAKELYNSAMNNGFEREDFSMIYEFLNNNFKK